MTDTAFFGYGSLVNLATHDYANPQPATLPGWRRVWRATSLRKIAFLSVEPDASSVISGITATVPNADWAALDQREAAYTRVDVTHTLNFSAPCAVYLVNDGLVVPPSAEHQILLSYLDCVAQGFLDQFGTDGLAQFFATTIGWTAIHNDRPNPIYPRAQTLTRQQSALVDSHLVTVLE